MTVPLGQKVPGVHGARIDGHGQKKPAVQGEGPVEFLGQYCESSQGTLLAGVGQ